MRRFASLASALVLALAAAGGVTSYARAAEEAAKTPEAPKATVEGEMVDMKCWVAMDMAGGGKHNKCAVDCAKMGIPVGVVDSRRGQTIVVLAPAPGLAPHMGKTVRITGDLAEKSTAIVPETLEIKEGDKWVKAELPGGMM